MKPALTTPVQQPTQADVPVSILEAPTELPLAEQSTGLEEIVEFQLDDLTAEVSQAETAPEQVGWLSRQFGEQALVMGGRSVEMAMIFGRKRQQLRESVLRRAVDGVRLSVGSGRRVVNETSLPELFILKGRHVAWAPFLAGLRVPVGVVTDTMAEATGLKTIFDELGIDPERYVITSVEWEGSEEAALKKIRRKFPEEIFQHVPLGDRQTDWAHIRDFLEKQEGIYFPLETISEVNRVASYLESLA